MVLWITITTFAQVDIYKGMPFVDNYSIADYKAGPVNRDITQYQNGILYFANNQGLLKYDGTAWELFKVKADFEVLSSLVNEEKIYVGSQFEFGYFQSDETGKLAYHSLKDRLEKNYIFGQVVRIEAIDNLIYFFSYDYVFILDGESLSAFKIPEVGGAVGTKQGLAISMIGKGIVILDDKGFTTLSEDDRLIYITLKGIVSTSKSRMLIFTLKNGIYVLENGKVSPWTFSHPEALKRVKISDVIKTRNGKYLISTNESGILEVDEAGKLLNIYNKKYGLHNNAVASLLQDNYGNVWAAHSNGISKIDYDSPFTKIDDNLGIQGVGNTVAMYERELYLGTHLGLYKYNSQDNQYELVPNSEGNVLSLQQIGNRFFVGHHEGVFIYEGGRLEKVSTHMGVREIRQVPDYDNKLILGGYHGLEILNISEQNTFLGSPIDFKGPCKVMEFDERGYLWTTHKHRGTFRFKIDFENDSLEEVKPYGDNGALLSDFFTNVLKIDNEVVFTGDNGIFQFNYSKEQFEVSEKFKKYFDHKLKIRELEEDHLGNIYYWGFSESGLIINPGKSSQNIVKEPFFQITNLASNGFINYTFVDEHNLFLGANEGFIHFDPHQISQQIDSFNLYVRQIDIIEKKDSTIYKHDFGKLGKEKIVIPYQSNALRFSCSAIFYTENEQTKYSYFIENFDKTWSPWTDKSEKEYINLPPGNYRFMVKAKNVFQTESNTASFAFRILPPWYRSKLAYLLYVIVAVTLFCIWYFDLLRRHTQEKDIIKSESRKEIDAKENQIEEISRNKTEEIMRLKNEKLEAEVNHKNQELASTALHLINKNQLLSNIRQNLTISRNADDPDIQNVVGKIDKSIKHDSNWEMFQVHFDRVHVDFTKRLIEKHQNLSPQDLKIAAYLRMNLSSKEMAELLNVSVTGIEKARYRLRKKINLERNENLTEYILNI